MAISDSTIGIAAGVGASSFWVLTTIFFTAGGKRIGVTAVNTLRMIMAIALLGTTHLILFGKLVPEVATTEMWVALALSGVIGLTICDQALFSAFLDIGPRKALLFMTTSPIFAAFFGYFILGEKLGPASIVGMLVTMAGIAWVVLERQETKPERSKHAIRGFIFVMIGAICQPLGGMFSKIGMGIGSMPEAEQVSPMAATLVRMVFGLCGMAPIVLISWRMVKKRDQQAIKPKWGSGVAFTFGGAVFGPYLGVWLSLVAMALSPLGIAQTLLSLSPVMILPFVKRLYNERLTKAAVLGAVVAVCGAGIISAADEIDRRIGFSQPSYEDAGDTTSHPAGQGSAEHGPQTDS
ncbi:MAG: DMT family transporter [Phycisphaerales bacterium]